MHSNPHLRPVEVGDICLLIEPHPQADITLLRGRQQELQTQHGGSLISHVHLSCQRFAAAEEGQLTDFVDSIRHEMKALMPFPLHAIALQTLPVPALHSTMLKWKIDISTTLLQFNAMVAEASRQSGLTTLYRAGFTSNLVSALRDLPMAQPDAQLQDYHLPYHLFDAAKIVLSQIHGPNHFRILATLFEEHR
ncbi:MAG: hypothetical protein R2867_36910 [Caldilineaceae bacterium]